ncbi:MAG: tetratricopeptide repeat protein, partial [bacterium]
MLQNKIKDSTLFKNNNRKLQLSMFLTIVITLFILLITLLLLQNVIFINLVKSIYSQIIEPTDKNTELLLSFVNSFRRNNSYIFISIGGIGILFSFIVTLVIGNLYYKKVNQITNQKYKALLKDKIKKLKQENEIIIDEPINSSDEVIKLINEMLLIIKTNDKHSNELNNSSSENDGIKNTLQNYKNNILYLEKENENLLKSFEYEKEKNEILFSQIEKMNLDNNKEKTEIINNKDKSIEKLLDEVLTEKKVNSYYKQDKSKVNIEDFPKSKKYNKTNGNSSLKTYNKSLNAKYKEIKSLCKNKKYNEALNLCINTLSSKEKRLPKFAYLIGYIYSQLKMNREAKKYLAILLSINPNNLEARNLFGVVQYRMGYKKEAIQQFKMVT